MAEPAAAIDSARPSWRHDFLFWLVLLVFAQLVIWTVLPWLFALSLPLDVVSDGLTWGHEWQWGYYKHPPLPSWTVEAFFDAFGDLGPFLLSQICIVMTYVFVFLLGCEMMPMRWAAAGTLLLTGVYYFSVPTPEFNHNIAQMPAWAAACFCYFEAWKTDRTRWWLGLGVVAGLGLLTKYSTALLLFVMLAHFVFTRGLKDGLRSSGPWIAAGICLVVISEHVLWLARSGFPSFHYAAERARVASGLGGWILAPVKFLSAQAIDVLPAVGIAWIAGLRPAPGTLQHNEKLGFLLWMTLGPPIAVALGSLATGMAARDMWGAPMWNLTGLIIVLSAAGNWKRASGKWLGAGAAALFAIGLGGFVVANVLVPELENRPSRIQWPDRSIARASATVWRQQVQRPLRIVAGDGWLGGLVAMRSVPRPSVWIDANYRKAPWITPEAVKRDGALLLWRVHPNESVPNAFTCLKGIQILGQKSFVWPETPKAAPLIIGYAILLPAGR
ncbi:MAG TPA: glycosyltransferase family 39 protein [Rhizomicrobium sp.]|jgi:4-amino-4-deoxy-L-arabinose transferase-like glycosyltransferase|nr:glycosyltransferase family 39 protein [Rhizomicrobium sp.]